MHIVIFRHGIAEDLSESGDDASRRLTPRGVERTLAAARGLAELIDPPTVILTSPKVRARQTADIAASVFDVPVQELDVLADGSAAQIVAGFAGRGEASVMLVGHEPTLSQTIGLLVAGPGPAGGYVLKKAGAALVEATPGPAHGRSRGILHWLVPPRALRALGGAD